MSSTLISADSSRAAPLVRSSTVAAHGALPGGIRPLVVGVPRSGFSLLIAVINKILEPRRREVDPKLAVVRRLCELSGVYVTRRYTKVFESLGLLEDLVFNGEFHRLVGGPKWLDPTHPGRACFRKYFGIRGQGDFLLVTSHPREALQCDDVVHSHTAPALWLQEPYYQEFQKFTSIRNPIGIINSASFSLNAMASEYLQRFCPEDEEDFVRQRHGLYKLTDLEFVKGLVKFLKGYLDEFLCVRGRYFEMRWEELIGAPEKTICGLAGCLGVPLSVAEAHAIWTPMDHVNLLQYHKHNYRRGKGIVGDWKNSLVNEHMEIFREFGFNGYLEALGYPPIPDLDPSDYSPYQKLIAGLLRRGEVYKDVGDVDLFGFAFNKSNIDATKFNFKSFPKRTWTHVERSTVADDRVVQAVSDVAEDSCERINQMLYEFLEAEGESGAGWTSAVRRAETHCKTMMEAAQFPDGASVCERSFQPFYVRHFEKGLEGK